MKHPSDKPPVVLGGFIPMIESMRFAFDLGDSDSTAHGVYFPIDGQYEPVIVRNKRYCCIHNGMWHIVRAV